MTIEKKFVVNVGESKEINIVTDFEISAGVSKIMLIQGAVEESQNNESVV